MNSKMKRPNNYKSIEQLRLKIEQKYEQITSKMSPPSSPPSQITSQQKGSLFDLCRSHKSQFQFYCKQCKTTELCLKCVADGKHSGHELVELEKARAYLKADMHQVFLLVGSRLDFLNSKEQIIQEEISVIDSSHQQLQQSIIDKFKICRKELRTKEKEILDLIDSIKKERMGAIEQDMKAFQAELQAYTAIGDTIQKIKSQSEDQMLFEYIRSFNRLQPFFCRPKTTYAQLTSNLAELKEKRLFTQPLQHTDSYISAFSRVKQLALRQCRNQWAQTINLNLQEDNKNSVRWREASPKQELPKSHSSRGGRESLRSANNQTVISDLKERITTFLRRGPSPTKSQSFWESQELREQKSEVRDPAKSRAKLIELLQTKPHQKSQDKSLQKVQEEWSKCMSRLLQQRSRFKREK